MASTLFADPPNATMEEARDHFLAAEELKPDGWKENRQYLAKSLIHLKDFPEALVWLDKASTLPIKNPDVSWFCLRFWLFLQSFNFQDQQAQNDIDELLIQHQCYRL